MCDPRPSTFGLVDYPLFQPGVATLQHVARQRGVGVVGVRPQGFEQRLHPQGGLLAERLGQLVGLLAAGPISDSLGFGPHARRGHGEQFGGDVDNPPEEALLLFHRGLPARHPVEGVAGQLASRALDESQMRGQVAELAKRGGPLSFAEHQLRQPLCIESARADRGFGLLPEVGLGVREVTRRAQVRVDGLTRDQQSHDLAGAFEDAVDPQVADHLLYRHRPLTARGQRLGGLVAASTADLQQLVADLAGHLARPQLGQRRLDPDVVAAFVRHLTGKLQDRFERVTRCGHERNLLDDGAVLADRLAPLHALTGPLPGDLQ